MAILMLLLPVLVTASGWIFSRLYAPLSRSHFTVALAEEIMLEDSGARKDTTQETRAFRAAGKPTKQLLSEAQQVQQKFKRGGWLMGIFIGFVFGLTLIRLAIHKKESQYRIDQGTCLSCGRCFIYCPYEQVRLGMITPEELEKIEAEVISEKNSQKG
jgi:ferredoxin